MGDNKQLLENLNNREFIPDKDKYFKNLLSELVGVSDNNNVNKKHEDLAVLLVSEIIKLLKKGEPDINPNVESLPGELPTTPIGEPVTNTSDEPISNPTGEIVTNTSEEPISNPTGETIENTSDEPLSNPPGEPVTPPTGPVVETVSNIPSLPEQIPLKDTTPVNVDTNGEPDKPTITLPLLPEKQKQILNGIPFPKTEIIEEQKVDGNTTQHTINYYHLTPNNPHQIISTIDNLHK
jgi:hypothetical protein